MFPPFTKRRRNKKSESHLQVETLEERQMLSTVQIFAAGTTGNENIDLLISGEVVATYTDLGSGANTGNFRTLTYNTNDTITADQVRIAFTNDFFQDGVDANVRIDAIAIDGVRFETEAPDVFSNGTYTSEGLQPGLGRGEFLHINGYFQYGVGSGNVIAQTGTLSVTQNVEGEWFDVTFDQELQDAIVVVSPVSFNGSDPVHARVRNVTQTGFQYQLEEWNFDDGSHTAAETISWFAVERGVHTLADGAIIEAGVARVDHTTENINFTASFDGAPVVIGQVASEVGVHEVIHRLDNVTTSGFQAVLQEEEGRDGNHALEDFHWIAFSDGEFDAFATGRFTADERAATTSLATGYDGVVLADSQTTNGTDTAQLRILNQTNTSLSLFVEEERSQDSEVGHANETIGWVRTNATISTGSSSSSSAGFVGLGDTLATVSENDGSVQIEVIRFDGSSGPATVFYQTLGATATDGSDFVGVTDGQVNFADGQTSAFITVDLLDDNVSEAVETFSISLSRAEGAELDIPRTALITILDNESGNGLIGHWQLDETQIGQTVVDSSGNGNSGVHQNITSPNGPTTDRPDTDTTNLRGVNFDGVDDFIQIESDPSLELRSGTFTQAVWIRPENSDNGFNGVLGFHPDSGGTANRYPGIWVYQQDRIHAGFGDGTNWNRFNTDSVLTVGEWNHVATTYDGTSFTAYVNGVEVFSTDEFAGRSPVISGEVTIGRVDNFFEGGIDDVRIYDRALSFAEISELIDGATVPTVPLSGQVVANQILAGFDTPIETEFLPDGRILVAEQAGLIQIINQNGTVASTPLLDIRNIVNAGTKDRGLIGFTVHPDFENNPFIYAAFTYDPPETAGQSGLAGPDGNGARVSRISRFTVNAAGTFADPNSEFILVGGNSTYANIGDPSVRPGANDPHSCINGNDTPTEDCIPADETSHTIGELEFGPDGALYIASGDGGAFGRVEVNNIRALDVDSLAGKILRIDPITGEGLSDNPFYDGDPDSNASKVFATGLRNPFRFAITDDPVNPAVYIGDVGWTQWEEINLARGGENFGWPAFEGGENGESFQTGRYEDLSEIQDFYATEPDVTAPTWARAHSDGGRAIVLGDFASDRYGDLAGTLFFTDIGDQVIRAARLNSAGEVVNVEVVSDGLGLIVDLETSPIDGYMYYTDVTGNIGRLELA